jgi:hypothetical protein
VASDVGGCAFESEDISSYYRYRVPGIWKPFDHDAFCIIFTPPSRDYHRIGMCPGNPSCVFMSHKMSLGRNIAKRVNVVMSGVDGVVPAC